MLSININAQDSGENTLGTWYVLTSSNRISDKISLSGSLINWNYNFYGNQHLVLGIVGVNYHISKNVVAGIGYGKNSIDSSFEDGNLYIHENRSLEQISIKHKTNKIAWNHRFRLEQRFLEYPTENKLIHRIRYRFKGAFPINKTLFISVYDEIHFNLNQFDFNQNRAFAGLGFKLNKNNNIILGYARHSFKTKSFHRFSFQLNLKYDLRKN